MIAKNVLTSGSVLRIVLPKKKNALIGSLTAPGRYIFTQRRKRMTNAGEGIRKVSVNGVELAYRLDGAADGRVVMMSNSLMCDHTMWDINVPVFTDRYRTLRYDTRGHGSSGTTPGPYSIAMLADDAVRLLDALGIRQVHFIGLSMGGMIGQQIGARYPERIYSLSLCDTASEMPPRSMWEERLSIASRQGTAGLLDATIQRWFTGPYIARKPESIEKVRRMILSTGIEGFAACASAVRDMAQTTMLLKVKAPTIVLVGRQDPGCTVEQSTVIHRMIDGSQMIVLEDAAHLSNIEQSHAFNSTLRSFIDRVDDTL
jgi:3-oxoadipate enol-lactonase